ncbi:unnamed protein product [Dracunculus medinensis]|uniref:TOG domain-containing protein n=1 Tax=Dracunculus medinensis TaxID=318479 RepID=A0A0N4U2F9_DRAME|nr:unnamed protein product [Dracunculus medinensis]
MGASETNLLALLPKDFVKFVSSVKWTERRDVLQCFLDNLAHSSRLNTEINYIELMNELKKIIMKDSNVIVISLAIRVLTAIVRGLQGKASAYISLILVPLLEKFKERKAMINCAITECIDEIGFFCNANFLFSSICNVLDNTQNPTVKAEIDHWIYRILLNYDKDRIPFDFIEKIAPYLIQHGSNGSSAVRNGCFMAFGGIIRLIGDQATMAIASVLFADKKKIIKMYSFCEKAAEEFAKLEQMKNSIVEKNSKNNSKDEESFSENKENSRMDSDRNATDFDPWEMLPETNIVLRNDFDTLLSSRQWKERKEALESLLEVLDQNPRLNPGDDYQPLIKSLSSVIANDVNINVLALAIRSVAKIAQALRYKFSSLTPKIMEILLEKFKEKKVILREPLIECIDYLSLITPLSLYVRSVEDALKKENPQIRMQTALFIARLFRQHSRQTLPSIELKIIAPPLLQLAFDSNVDCRDASYSAIGAVMKSIGEKDVGLLFSGVLEDSIKYLKIKEQCDNFLKEFGCCESKAILRLSKIDVENNSGNGSSDILVKNITLKPNTNAKYIRKKDSGFFLPKTVPRSILNSTASHNFHFFSNQISKLSDSSRLIEANRPFTSSRNKQTFPLNCGIVKENIRSTITLSSNNWQETRHLNTTTSVKISQLVKHIAVERSQTMQNRLVRSRPYAPGSKIPRLC